jgi:hypothetical protein
MEKSEHREEKVMLGTSHTSNKTESIYDHKRQQENSSSTSGTIKFSKKTTESSRPTANPNHSSIDNVDELIVE